MSKKKSKKKIVKVLFLFLFTCSLFGCVFITASVHTEATGCTLQNLIGDNIKEIYYATIEYPEYPELPLEESLGYIPDFGSGGRMEAAPADGGRGAAKTPVWFTVEAIYTMYKVDDESFNAQVKAELGGIGVKLPKRHEYLSLGYPKEVLTVVLSDNSFLVINKKIVEHRLANGEIRFQLIEEIDFDALPMISAFKEQGETRVFQSQTAYYTYITNH